MLHLMVFFGKFHIHKSKINNSEPCLKVFMVDVHSYKDPLQFIYSKVKSKSCVHLESDLIYVVFWIISI